MNLTLSWLVTNEDYYLGTLAEWVKNGTFLTLLRKLKRYRRGLNHPIMTAASATPLSAIDHITPTGTTAPTA
ncbi:MAG: hypothetical protein U1U88_001294 [Lawsonella clevelandensis]